MKQFDDDERVPAYRLGLWMFTLLCVVVLVLAAIPAYLMFGMAVGPSISSHQFFPRTWSQAPMWLLAIGGLTMPFALPATLFAAWSFYKERKFAAVRVTAGIGLVWLVPGVFVLSLLAR